MEIGHPWLAAKRNHGLIFPTTHGQLPRQPDLLPLPAKIAWEQIRRAPPHTWVRLPPTPYDPAVIAVILPSPREGAYPDPVPTYSALWTTLGPFDRWTIVTPVDGPLTTWPPWWPDWIRSVDQATAANALRIHWVGRRPLRPADAPHPAWSRPFDFAPLPAAPARRRRQKGTMSGC